LTGELVIGDWFLVSGFWIFLYLYTPFKKALRFMPLALV